MLGHSGASHRETFVKTDRSEESDRATGEERMDSLLEGERLHPSHMRALAAALLDRHARALSAPDAAPGPDFFRGVLDSLAARHTLPSALRERLETNLEENADRLLARAGRGRILAAADELTPMDVYFNGTDGNGSDGAVAEGAESVRITPDPGRAFGIPVDAALEVASLSIWLARYERADLSEILISRYANEAEDFDLYLVLDFYEAFCALTQDARAKDASDTASTVLPPIPSARTALTRPIVVAMSGPVASGKSTLARSLSDRLASPLTVADRIRDHFVHGVPGRPVHEAGWANGFEPGFAARVYGAMFHRGETVLQSGRPIILDACFSTSFQRAAARALARRHGAPFLFVECRVDPETQRQRLSGRDAQWDDDPGAWAAIAADLAERFVLPADIAVDERIEVDTSADLDAPLEQVLSRLTGRLLTQGLATPK
jgi:Predicted kinase